MHQALLTESAARSTKSLLEFLSDVDPEYAQQAKADVSAVDAADVSADGGALDMNEVKEVIDLCGDDHDGDDDDLVDAVVVSSAAHVAATAPAEHTSAATARDGAASGIIETKRNVTVTHGHTSAADVQYMMAWNIYSSQRKSIAGFLSVLEEQLRIVSLQ